jgi:catechol 2,3-dioxygenase-like lactoylglutathione lyase family enzyme
MSNADTAALLRPSGLPDYDRTVGRRCIYKKETKLVPLKTLDHVNVRTRNLDVMVDWYRDILGMETGPRPGFQFGGAWLYCDGKPIVHLVEVSDEPAAIAPKIEHFAIAADGLEVFLSHLEARDVDYEIGRPPGFPIIQVNIFDPDGNHIHVDFHSDEAEALARRGV